MYIVKRCAIATTSPPDLLEHIAREAHYLWGKLKEAIRFTEQVCSKSSEVHPSIIWSCCLRTDSIRNLYAPFK